MKALFFILSFLILTSCVPIKIAPDIKTDKVMVAKKFKKQLPKKYAFIFNDPKDANEFYKYITSKFQLNDSDVGLSIPFTVDDDEYYLSFYETENFTKTIPLAPIIADIAVMAAFQEGTGTAFTNFHTSRTGKWYLVLTVNDKDSNDCLTTNYKNREAVLTYLRKLKTEYLTTNNYHAILFRKTQF